ncbi:hypothetical protein ABEB36_001861 [Hypothenemus hampei]|uniref:Uncharacterized protein n=1 Tax=Hypothenemus hampei TaxID=57062 RepID=A0ABD1FFY3_HYPHA
MITLKVLGSILLLFITVTTQLPLDEETASNLSDTDNGTYVEETFIEVLLPGKTLLNATALESLLNVTNDANVTNVEEPLARVLRDTQVNSTRAVTTPGEFAHRLPTTNTTDNLEAHSVHVRAANNGGSNTIKPDVLYSSNGTKSSLARVAPAAEPPAVYTQGSLTRPVRETNSDGTTIRPVLYSSHLRTRRSESNESRSSEESSSEEKTHLGGGYHY